MRNRLLLCGIGLLALASCGGGEEDTPAATGNKRADPVELILIDGRPAPSVLADVQVLHRDNGDEPQTLDPHLAEGVPSATVLRDLFEGLTTESPDGRVVPGTAARWNISRDGRTYTFYLRREARWSNGEPLLAGDFVYSFRRSADPRTASNYAHVLLPIQNAAEILAGTEPAETLGVTALDDYTVQIQLVDPTPYFLGLLSHSSTYPLHRASVEQHGPRFSHPGNLVSNGAFVLTEWKVRSHLDLVKNINYWDAENVVLDKVVYYPFEDQSTAVKQYRSGGLHWTYEVPSNQFKWLQQHYPDELVISPWMGSYFFGFNLSQEPFVDNPELRLALSMAIDRRLITEKVTQFGEQPSYSLVPPGIGDYISPRVEWADWTQEQRNEEARRLYALAGYDDERPLRLEIRYNTSENHKKMSLAVASMWKQTLGVQASLINEEWKVFLQNRSQRILTEVFRAGWISDYSDPYSFLSLFASENGQNDYAFNNSMYDSLLGEIAAERIPARRQRLMFEAERILLAEAPIMPVLTNVTKRLVDPHVKGWQSNVMDHHYSKNMFLLRSVGSEPVAVPLPQTQPVQSPEVAPVEGLEMLPGEESSGQ